MIPPAPAVGTGVTLVPASWDSVTRDPFTEPEAHTHYTTFVDDKLIAELVPRIQLAIQRSTAACYLLLGHPRKGVLTPSLFEDKFPAASWRMEQLGLNVDTRAMIITYSLPKRSDLLVIIDLR